MNRKQFISTLTRTSLLAVMAGIVTLFIKRDSIGKHSDCSIDFQCKKCNKVNGCTLPEAAKYKNNGQG